MEQLTQLTHLRSLSLAVKPNGGWQLAHAESLSAHNDCLEHLSCLTALTRLELQLEAVCEPWGDSYIEYQRALAQPAYCEDDYEIRMYEAITERRHTLVYALRDMPSMQRLSCPGLWITPSELAPLPSSLIHLEIEGLLPPTFDEIADAEALDTPLLWDLPPQLRELRLLGYAACPRALAAIRPPPEVKGQTHGLKLHCFQLRFGVDDVVGSRGRLWDASEEAVGPALELLRATRPRPGEWTLQVAADGSKWPMGPPEDEEEGHEGWIGQLQAAGEACTGLVLHNMSLRAGDLEALTRAMPQLKVGRGGTAWGSGAGLVRGAGPVGLALGSCRSSRWGGGKRFEGHASRRCVAAGQGPSRSCLGAGAQAAKGLYVDGQSKWACARGTKRQRAQVLQ